MLSMTIDELKIKGYKNVLVVAHSGVSKAFNGYLVIVMLLVAILIVLIIIGANMCKTDYERQLDDEEQMEFLREYQNKKAKK